MNILHKFATLTVWACLVLVSSLSFATEVTPQPSADVRDFDHEVWLLKHSHNFEQLLERYEAANTAFVNGDPAPWLAMTAEEEPASIFGGFGGLGETGTAEVHQRYLLAARAFQPSGAVVDFEYLVKDVRGRLAAGWPTRWPSNAPRCSIRGKPGHDRKFCGLP